MRASEGGASEGGASCLVPPKEVPPAYSKPKKKRENGAKGSPKNLAKNKIIFI